MFTLTLDGSRRFRVSSRSGLTEFATDGSAANPFEAALAAVAACAGVYAQKACAAAGVSAEGIRVDLKPTVTGSGLQVRRLALQIEFPEGFPAALEPAVLASVDACPVKELIRHGDRVEFQITAAHALALAD